MTGLGMVVGGFLVIIADLRINGFDLLCDPIGWVLVLLGVVGLTRTHWGFGLAAASSVAGLAVSLGSVTQEPGSIVSTLDSVATTGVVFGTCSALIALSAAPADRRAAGIIRWVDLTLTAVGVAAFAVTDGEAGLTAGGGLVALILVLALVAFGVAIWFLLLVWRVRRDPAYAPVAR